MTNQKHKSAVTYVDKSAPESHVSEQDALMIRDMIKKNSPDVWSKLLEIESRDGILEPVEAELNSFIRLFPRPLNVMGIVKLSLLLRGLARKQQ